MPRYAEIKMNHYSFLDHILLGCQVGIHAFVVDCAWS